MCFQDHRYPDIQELNVDSVSFSIPFLCASWMCSYVSDTTTYHFKGILPSSLPKPFILRHGDAEIWTLTTTYVRIHETPFSVAWIRMNSKDDTLGPFVSFGGVWMIASRFNMKSIKASQGILHLQTLQIFLAHLCPEEVSENGLPARMIVVMAPWPGSPSASMDCHAMPTGELIVGEGFFSRCWSGWSSTKFAAFEMIILSKSKVETVFFSQ